MQGSHAVVLEIFCGTAGLSAALKQLGFDVIAIDKLMPRSPKAMVTKLDLTQYATQQLVFEWIQMPQVKAVFLAPPCGTASMARTIQLEGEENLPKPLRTLEQPDGVDHLAGWDFLRVEQSNILYDFVAACYELCCKLGKLFVCENPKDSLFWSVTPWCEREFQDMEVEQIHQACAYGSMRPKWTKLVANFEEIHRINLTCPGNHKHEPWGVQKQDGRRVFATALEVHYPSKLCETIAETIALALRCKNVFPLPAALPTQAARAFTHVQAGTNKVPTFLPEFKTKFVSVLHDGVQVWPAHTADFSLSKLLYEAEVGGEDIQQLCNALCEQCALKNFDVCLNVENLSILDTFPCIVQLRLHGIYWSEEEFLQKAVDAKHPLDVELAIPKELRDALLFNLQNSDHVVASHRAKFLSHWIDRAKQLSNEEKALKQSMEANVAEAVSSKRILLFKEMLCATGFPDIDVVDELILGSDLTGQVPTTGMLPGKFVPALLTVQELQKHSVMVRPKLDNDKTGSGDPDIDSTVWHKTLDEVAKGWLEGPLSPERVPHDQPISRRFGLLQKKGKVRLIDDYTESGVNKCVTSVESPVLHTTDVACALLALWFSMCGERGCDPCLVARTFDLTSAYRQVALSSDGRRFARVFDPHHKCHRYFRSRVLPFGAVRSVHAFLRLSRAIWWIGATGCGLLWTSFYDDFISFSKPSLSRCTETTIEALFKLLGWFFAEEGDKCLPFGNMCDALGVSFDLSSSSSGFAAVRNTDSRVQELCSDLRATISDGKLSAKQAQRLRGRMQFAEGQLFGRTGRRCLRALSSFAEGEKQVLDDKDIFFLDLFCKLLHSNVPREVRAFESENVVIFTDACYESEDAKWPCGLGGVLYHSGQVLFFSLPVNKTGRDTLGEQSKQQIIFEAETLAAVLAFLLWKDHFKNKRCLIFVDNEGTKFSLLKGSSSNQVVDVLAGYFAEMEAQIHSFTWIARVPSKSNIADPPSRNDIDLDFFRRANNVSSEALPLLNLLLTRLNEDGVTDLVGSHHVKKKQR